VASVDQTSDQSVSQLYRRGAALVARSMRLRPKQHAIAIAGACVFAVAAVALTRALAWATDNAIVPGLDGDGVDSRTVVTASALILGIGLTRGMGSVVRRYYLATARYGTELEWRRQLFGRFLDLPMSFHRARSTGELLAHADNDMLVATTALMPLAFTVATVVLVLIALVNLLVIHVLLAVVAIVLFPVLAVMNQVYSKRVVAPASAAQEAVGRTSAIAHESFEGAMVVKALGREQAEVARFRAAATAVRDERVTVGRLRAMFEPAIDALPNLGVIAILMLGAFLVDKGSLTVGELVGAMTLFTILAFPMRVVGFFLEELPKSVVALDRIDAVLDLELPDKAVVAGPQLPHGPLDFEAANLGARYGSQTVLDNVSFRVEPGEAVAIVGSTGVGKSTLADILVGLQDPTAGSIRVAGVPTGDLDNQARSQAVAVAFQEAFLFADSILENVVLGRDLDVDQAWRSLELAGADEFVRALPNGIDTVVGERGVSLSGGQRQRVALARALVANPRVLFLDDSTSAVDPVVEARILNNLRTQLEITLLIVAHRLSTIELADRVVFLHEGTVRGVGSHDELLSIPAYAALTRAYETEAS